MLCWRGVSGECACVLLVNCGSGKRETWGKIRKRTEVKEYAKFAVCSAAHSSGSVSDGSTSTVRAARSVNHASPPVRMEGSVVAR